MSEGTKTWEQLIIDYSKKKPKFKSRTCKIYDINSPCPADRDKLCLCDRMIRRHSYTGDSLRSQSSENGDNKWESPKNFAVLTHTCHAPINVYGTLKPINCKFLRIDNRVEIKDLFELILEDCNNQKPDLILSIYGGAKYFSMTEKLEKEVIRDLIDAAYATNAWILTAGVNNGVSKLVGEGISHYSILRAYPNTVKCIGMTMWGTIDENTRLELRTAAKSLCERQTPENVQDDKASIEKNHTHCILFDGGTLNDYLSDSHRHKFVTEACRNKDDNHTCYPVTIIIEGGLGSLEVIKNDVEQKRPIVLIKVRSVKYSLILIILESSKCRVVAV
ncbi:unnamed protein product [Rotaria sp. Silwood2]|nr:unnamed protein product [Rotaria sp. Silwood2]CAF3169441.1 unnamed protein product [Rotaria sp. Silwood2]CAF3452145.1 unnamed protein product [Rotaria sp. Silwood2]CAF4549240.1 unnamed protein product [Rotaria sp. Silwood2]